MKLLIPKSITSVLLVLSCQLIIAQSNVGIGTNNPASKLDVRGNVTIGDSFSGTAAPANGLIIEGNVGIGTASPRGALEVNGNIVPGGMNGCLGTSGAWWDTVFIHNIISSSGDGVVFAENGVQKTDSINFYWDNVNKRLGIGLANPVAKLQVAGNILPDALGRDIGSSSLRWDAYIDELNTTIPNGAVLFSDNGDVSGDPTGIFWDDSNDFLGVGTASPTDVLTVAGNISPDVTGIRSIGTSTLRWDGFMDDLNLGMSDGAVVFSKNGILSEDPTGIFWDDSNDFLGVGTATPTDALTVAGNVTPDLSGVRGIGTNSLRWNVFASKINAGFADGSIIFSKNGELTEDNTGIFWDDSNDYFGVGTPNPETDLDILGNTNDDAYIRVKSEGANTSSGIQFNNDGYDKGWRMFSKNGRLFVRPVREVGGQFGGGGGGNNIMGNSNNGVNGLTPQFVVDTTAGFEVDSMGSFFAEMLDVQTVQSNVVHATDSLITSVVVADHVYAPFASMGEIKTEDIKTEELNVIGRTTTPAASETKMGFQHIYEDQSGYNIIFQHPHGDIEVWWNATNKGLKVKKNSSSAEEWDVAIWRGSTESTVNVKSDHKLLDSNGESLELQANNNWHSWRVIVTRKDDSAPGFTFDGVGGESDLSGMFMYWYD